MEEDELIKKLKGEEKQHPKNIELKWPSKKDLEISI